ncbi:NAD(P)/FAD-dependent oxidoreductase [Flavobacterium algicola]|uniref:NAD(P)/FAD-dependent oxidoreductase n=1 Tax=Flavobacterium algicola TaxID=556529 RepID=UPI001EFE8FA0|nr:NAD(P)/FAD-dependent oxidoreductase [Flavobacterium algicola]MCG9793297.1 NAD(P)/FAD-dependent oxidoreductase [Flavobacterium algicola]
MEHTNGIVIIGAGLSGMTSAIHLLTQGFSVTVLEKNSFPKHKVCGEFISNEVWSYLNLLDLDIESLNPTKINSTFLSTPSGRSIETNLPLGGFGISRYTLDYYLYQKVQELGGVVIQSNVTDVLFSNDQFVLTTDDNQNYTAKVVLGSFGKRSNLDLQLNRDFIKKKSPWLAVKAHYALDLPADVVMLHNFEGGYCGVSKVEDDKVNICYLVRYSSFKKYKDIADFQENVMATNPHLKTIFKNSKMIFEKPLTISQISFEDKPKIENHMIMIGDAAGMIHPLCGNGMAIAIHSAKIASELTIRFLQNKITRIQFESQYVSRWNKTFRARIQFGKFLSKILLNERLSKLVMKSLIAFPFLLPFIIKKTHGKPV